MSASPPLSLPLLPEPNAVQVATTPNGITTITLNRQHRRNAVDPPTARKLFNAFTVFEDDPTQKVAILTGANGTFCAGFDLIHLASQSQQQQHQPELKSRKNTAVITTTTSSSSNCIPLIQPKDQISSHNAGPMGPSRMQLAKPLICAVAGHAVAGGLELSLLGDIRVVEENTVFGVFCRRFGVPLIDGGTVRLHAVVGLGRALDMILTGRAVGAQEALAMGLANRVVAPGKALEEAMKIANELVRFPQECLRVDRLSCYFAAFEAKGLEEALRAETERATGVIQRESIEGAGRFAKGAGRHGKL